MTEYQKAIINYFNVKNKELRKESVEKIRKIHKMKKAIRAFKKDHRGKEKELAKVIKNRNKEDVM